VKHQQMQTRASDATFDIGAFEYGSGGTPAAPADPTNLQGTATGALGCDLSWTDNSNNETGFRIERREVGGSYAQVATVGANVATYSDSGLTNLQDYNYRVFAYNGGGDSGASNEITITGTSTPTAPAAPSGLNATAQSGLSIQVSWSDNSSNEDGFRLERDEGAGFVQIQQLAADITSFNDSGLTESVTYTYRVRAYNAVDNSAYSNTDSATAVQTTGGGGGGGGNSGGGGCSTGSGSAWWLLCLVPLALMRRRAA